MKKILVVDDSALMRRVYYDIIEHDKRFQVENFAKDGVEALQFLRNKKYDAVILDVNMPNMNGIELIKSLRQTIAYKFTPIIALTTESQDDKMQEGKAAGATGWIVKPFTSEKLIAIVNKILG